MTRKEYINKIQDEWLRKQTICYTKSTPYLSITNQDLKAIAEAFDKKIPINIMFDAIKIGIQIHKKNHGNEKPPVFRYILAVAQDLSNGRKKPNKKEAYYDPAKQW